MMYKKELEIDVMRCLRALKKRIRVIVLITVLFAGIGVALTLEVKPDMYSATSTVYSVSEGSFSAAATGITAMNAYSDIASSNKVCNRAALLLGRPGVTADIVRSSVHVNTVAAKSSISSSLSNQNASVIQISATSIDPALSMEMADAVADAFVIEMENIVGNNTVQVLDQAYQYSMTFNGVTDAWKTRILTTSVGFALACLMVVFFEIFDAKVRTVREGSIYNNLPVIGVIPGYKKKEK